MIFDCDRTETRLFNLVAPTFMKQLLTLLCFFAGFTVMNAQKTLPSANVKTLEGQNFNVSELANSGKTTVISFWATWCSPCKKELDAIMDYYEDWQTDYNMELIAVSIDDSRTAAKIPSMVTQKGWDFKILHDNRKEFQNAIGVNSVPFTLVLDKDGNIVYEHTGYAPGDELDLEDKLKELASKAK